MASRTFLAVVIVLAVFAPVLTQWSPELVRASFRFADPSAQNWLGGDASGRDALTVLLFGARTALLTGGIAVAVGFVLGTTAGFAAGVRGGRVDRVSYRVLRFCTPVTIGALFVLVGSGGSGALPVLVGALLIPGFFRSTREATLAIPGERPLAARRTIRRLVPAIGRPLAAHTLLSAAAAIVLLAILNFLDQSSTPSWGGMLRDPLTVLQHAPQLFWAAAGLLVMTVTALLVQSGAIALLSAGGIQSLITADAPSPAALTAAGPRDFAEDPMPSRWFRASTLLDVRGLRISTGAEGPDVVQGVSLSIGSGEVVALLGLTGSGTTEIALAIAGLLPGTADVASGTILFDGRELVGLPDPDFSRLRGRRIGYVPQNPLSNLDPSCSVGSQLSEPLRRHLGLSRAAAHRRALELLDRVGVVDPERTYQQRSHALEAVTAQRVLIAGAVSCDPDLLVAVDPTGTLGPAAQEDILDLLAGIQKERGLTMVLATHNFGVVASSCQRVAVLRAGEVVEYTSVRDLFRAPQHPYTRALLESARADALRALARPGQRVEPV